MAVLGEGSSTRLLVDLRVLNLGSGIVAGYCTKLLSDFGARVVNVEPPLGDPLRRWSASRAPGGCGLLHEFLHAGQRSHVADITDADALLGGADVVIETGDRDVDPGALRERFPRLSVVSVTPYGRSGPWSGRPASDLTLQAGCGSMWMRGAADREPLQVGGRLGEWIGGSYAAVAALACVRGARVSGRGDHADISLLECMAVSMHAGAIHRLAATEPSAVAGRTLDSPAIELTVDGIYVGLSVITGQQYLDLFALVERPELGEEWGAQPGARIAHRDEVRRLVGHWVADHTAAEVLERAALLRIPVSVVGTPDTIPEFDHFMVGGHYRSNPRGFLNPRSPFRVDGAAVPPSGPAPSLGEMVVPEPWPPRRSGPLVGAAGPAGPLDGVRVVDLTAFLAGPSATHLLAALGADVIKVEAIQRPDPIRYFGERLPTEDQWWECGTTFNYINTNKRDITLDLNCAEARSLLDRLCAGADVLVENFTPRVMDSFDLGWDRLHAAFPHLIVVRMPAFGLTGPWRDHPGYAYTIEQTAGMAWLTGYSDGPPLAPGGPADLLAGLHAAFAAVAALADRSRAGRGRSIEVPMVDVGLNVAAELVIERTGTGALLERQGNRGPHAAPQGVYQCAGADRWLAIAVETDEQWRSLRALLGGPAWASSASLDHDAGRRAAHDAIDVELRHWCADADADALFRLLDGAGIPAAAVCTPEEFAACVQTRDRNFMQLEDHPVTGARWIAGPPLRLRSRPGSWIRTPAPLLGQHNDEVFGTLLGCSREERAGLAAEGVVGTRPLGL